MSSKGFPHEDYTSIYHRQPIQESLSHPMLVLIPGNPGLIDFYYTYLNLIQQKYPTFEILCISHAGFKSDDVDVNDASFKYFDLEFQVNHKIDILRHHIFKDNRRRQLYFLSHSMGSYVTQRVIYRLINDGEIKTQVDIKFLGLICPTIIDICQSSSGQLFTKIFASLPIIQFALFLSAFLNFVLPEAVIKAIIRKFVIDKPTSTRREELQSIEHSAIGAFKIFKTKSIIQQALYLTKEEMITIVKDDEFNDWFFKDLLAKHGITIWTYFAHSDHWVHDNTRDYIITRYHDDENRKLIFQIGNFEDSITHSFCVNKSIEFSQITCEKLSESFS